MRKKLFPFIISVLFLMLGFVQHINAHDLRTRNGSLVSHNHYCQDLYHSVAYLNAYWSEAYPNAQLIGNSDCTKNCHSYAFGDYNGWINTGGETIYWNDGSYLQAPLAKATHLYYLNNYGGTHSARIEAFPTVTSKWGTGPIMRHAYNYTPYSTYGYVYYAQPYAVLSTSSSVYVGTGNAYSYFSGNLIFSNTGFVANLVGEINSDAGGPLPSNYVSVPAYSGNVISVPPDHQGSMPFWGYRPSVYVPPRTERIFYMYAYIPTNGGTQLVSVYGYVTNYFPPDPCGGEDEPSVAIHGSPETEKYDAKFKKFSIETDDAISKWSQKQVEFYKKTIEQNLNGSLGFIALAAWRELACSPSAASKERDDFIAYLRVLVQHSEKQDIYGYAELALSNFETQEESKLAHFDRVIKNFGASSLGETGLLEKFTYLMYRKNAEAARKVSNEIDGLFGNSLSSYETHLRLGDQGYTESEFEALLSKHEASLKQQKSLPETMELHANYPNPFNPSTTISYSLPKESFVNLTVYNSLGQLVKTLVSESQSPGYYTIKWDGTNNNGASVASGTYFYRLESEKFISTQKMMYLK